MAKEKKQEKRKKRIRYDWVKLQEELDLYKIENRGKTIKDFCKLKKINYATARLKLKITKSKQKAIIFDKQRSETFDEAVKKKHPKRGKGKLLPIFKKPKFLTTS